MRVHTKKKSLLFILLLVGSFVASAKSKRLIVKYKGVSSFGSSALVQSKQIDILKLSKHQKLDEVIKNLKSNPQVEYVEEDKILKKFSTTPNDTEYLAQWSLHDSVSGMNLPFAWDISLGDSSYAVAVVDTGVNHHQDLTHKISVGADLIGDLDISNDGNGRDVDASDPGDWIDSNSFCYQEVGRFVPSSWHGTHVAGSIAASTDNNLGMSGVNWNATIVPVRVLGTCGGYTTDIADGIRWAAGGLVNGLPVNTTPVKVINLSLGGEGQCSRYMQEAIDFARSKKIAVVVASGNSNLSLNTNSITPVNCKGVIRVSSHNQAGQKSSFSNYGKGMHVSAPGGESGGNGVLSLVDIGQTSPQSDSYSSYNGTSMSAANVSGVVSLAYSLYPDLYPDQIIHALVRSSKSYSQFSSCKSSNNDICGFGMVDAKSLLDFSSTLTPDADFVYDDNFKEDDVQRGTFPLQSPSGGGDGGACGSITLIKKEKKNFFNNFFLSALLGISICGLCSTLRLKTYRC